MGDIFIYLFIYRSITNMFCAIIVFVVSPDSFTTTYVFFACAGRGLSPSLPYCLLSFHTSFLIIIIFFFYLSIIYFYYYFIHILFLFIFIFCKNRLSGTRQSL
eukprot:gene2231-1392_t